MRPCLCDLPRCPICGYTKHDASFEGDHSKCTGEIPRAPDKVACNHESVNQGVLGDEGFVTICNQCGKDLT
jgi:hypothetical protein